MTTSIITTNDKTVTTATDENTVTTAVSKTAVSRKTRKASKTSTVMTALDTITKQTVGNLKTHLQGKKSTLTEAKVKALASDVCQPLAIIAVTGDFINSATTLAYLKRAQANVEELIKHFSDDENHGSVSNSDDNNIVSLTAKKTS